MAAAIRHRGPDGYGLLLDPGAGLVAARLAIFDIPGGWQPIGAPGTGGAIVYNGEVYNHPELRAELQAAGERDFRTATDTEVVLRLLERYGLEALHRLNGQFALAWWQPENRRLTLVRDRFGVRPLHYSLLDDGTLVFGSEAKALFASGEVDAAPDLDGIDDVFTLWGARAPRSVFAGVSQVEPGGIAVWERGELIEKRRWWRPEYGGEGGEEAELEELLRDSVRLRLRADVPVGTYLSGGLDSSLVTAIAQAETEGELSTFSVAFSDAGYDERAQQQQVAEAIGTRHRVIEVGGAEIAAALPDVVRHTETPLIRTAPVPLYLLARQVRSDGISVVASGEGADELFWGYDLFKEVVLRALNKRDPARAEELLAGLYGYLGGTQARRGPGWSRFLLETGADDKALGSHLTRAEATMAARGMMRDELLARPGSGASLGRLREQLPAGFARLEPPGARRLARGDHPARALSAVGPGRSRLDGPRRRGPLSVSRSPRLRALDPPARAAASSTACATRRCCASSAREAAAGRDRAARQAALPRPGGDAVLLRRGAGLGRGAALRTGARAHRDLGSGRVESLVRRCRAGRATGVREGMALVGVLSTQLWHDAFFEPRPHYPAETAAPRVRIDRSANRRPRRSCEQPVRADPGSGLTSRTTSSTCTRTSSWPTATTCSPRRVDSLGLRRAGRGGPGRYDVAVEDVEITEQNFGSVDSIVDFVARKRG